MAFDKNENLISLMTRILKNLQLIFHYCLFIGSLLYSLYRFQQSSITHKSEIYPSDWDTTESCLLCWASRDGTDLEWQIAKQYFIGTSVIWFICHSFGFFIVRQTFPQFISQFIILYSSFVIIQIFGFEILSIFLINSLIYLVFDYFFISKNSFIFLSLNYLMFIFSILVIHLLELFQDPGHNLLTQVMISWLNAKCLSASLDRPSISNKTLSFQKYLIRRFAYLLYFPPLFFGPIYHSSDFDYSIDKLENGLNKFHLSFFQRILYVTRIFIWAFLFEILKQFLFSSCYQYYIFILERFDTWSLAGYGFSLTITFYLKYLVIYGISKSFSELDGLENVIASPPECIAHMNRTSYLWRRFDQGLYRFLVKYFYKPLTGNAYTKPERKF